MYYAFSEVFKLCETENLNFAVYFMIDKHSCEQVHLEVKPKSFLYDFLNSGDTLMPCNKQFTNQVTWSIIEIQSPHFYYREQQSTLHQAL